MSATKARILVVEDDPAILTGLMDVLVFNGYHVDGVDDGRDGLQTALEHPFDLIILDVMLPSLDGFSICRRIRERRPSQGILMLTAKGAEDDVVTGFKAGADDYVCKPFSLRELMVRVEALLRRSGRLSGETDIQSNGIRFLGKTLEATYGKTSMALSRREMEIITFLHRHQDRIVSKKELLTEVWHYADADIETRTVDIHMLKLRKKIAELIGERPFIHTVRGQGYRLATDDRP
ncbi:MAG: response regulator transcription factor [Desulfobacterales bacterium]|jgi:two-component system response regulator RegX3